MILVREVLKMKFGKAREVKALMLEAKNFPDNPLAKSRIMFDLVGPAYTMVIENTHANLAEFEADMSKVMSTPEWQEWYKRFIPTMESSYREIFTIFQ